LLLLSVFPINQSINADPTLTQHSPETDRRNASPEAEAAIDLFREAARDVAALLAKREADPLARCSVNLTALAATLADASPENIAAIREFVKGVALPAVKWERARVAREKEFSGGESTPRESKKKKKKNAARTSCVF
jgi:hypothetical protein